MLGCILSVFAVIARGEESIGIVVTGTGEELAKPDQAEVPLFASGAAELTSDALVQFQDSLRRTLEAYEKLGMSNMEVRQGGVKLKNNTGMDAAGMGMVVVGPGGGGAAPAAQIQITRDLRVVVTGIDKLEEVEVLEVLGRIMDTAKDSGAGIETGDNSMARVFGRSGGSTAVAKFVVSDSEGARQKAYDKAFSNAQARAKKLAQLAGRKLGKVLSVEEVAPPPKEAQSAEERVLTMVYGGSAPVADDDTRLTADAFEEIPVRVTLRIRFEID